MAQRTPVSEQRRLVARWRRSQQSMAGFAKSIGVPQSTFVKWTQKYTTETAVAVAAPAFIEVTAEPVTVPVAVQLQVENARAVRLTFEALPDASWFAAVVREVTAC